MRAVAALTLALLTSCGSGVAGDYKSATINVTLTDPAGNKTYTENLSGLQVREDDSGVQIITMGDAQCIISGARSGRTLTLAFDNSACSLPAPYDDRVLDIKGGTAMLPGGGDSSLSVDLTGTWTSTFVPDMGGAAPSGNFSAKISATK